MIQTFTPSSPTPFAPPFHPQLHTAGPFTHPIILLLNALLAQKRIIFLGHGQPAGHVANFVLAACALTAPVLRGFAERAFPYSNLAGLDMLEEIPGYVAGVTNPRFEDLPHTWDLLCNLETGKITVSKGLSLDGSERDVAGKGLGGADGIGNDTESISGPGGQANKEWRSYNPDSSDNIFMEEVCWRGPRLPHGYSTDFSRLYDCASRLTGHRIHKRALRGARYTSSFRRICQSIRTNDRSV